MTTRWLVAWLFVLGVPAAAWPLTVQVDRTQPAVQAFADAYIRFPVHEKEWSSVAPRTFYVITPRSERETVLVAKVGAIAPHSGLASFLADLAGPQPQKTPGPHGVTILSDPAAEGKRLSAYAVWKDWLFVSLGREALASVLAGAARPQALVGPEQAPLSDGPKGPPGIRFWADNARGELASLLKESQKKVLIPLIRDPAQIGEISGNVRIAPSGTLTGQVTILPLGSQHQAPLKGDLKFLLESARRRLTALGVPYHGSLVETPNGLLLTISIGDYTKAQQGLIKFQP